MNNQILDTSSIVERINHGSKITMTGREYLMYLSDNEIARSVQREHAQHMNAVIAYTFASIAAIAAALIATNGLFVH